MNNDDLVSEEDKMKLFNTILSNPIMRIVTIEGLAKGVTGYLNTPTIFLEQLLNAERKSRSNGQDKNIWLNNFEILINAKPEINKIFRKTNYNAVIRD